MNEKIVKTVSTINKLIELHKKQDKCLHDLKFALLSKEFKDKIGFRAWLK